MKDAYEDLDFLGGAFLTLAIIVTVVTLFCLIVGLEQAAWNHGISNVAHGYGAPDQNLDFWTTFWLSLGIGSIFTSGYWRTNK